MGYTLVRLKVHEYLAAVDGDFSDLRTLNISEVTAVTNGHEVSEESPTDTKWP